jgi:glucose-1-phosphate cytidylyltransferase
MKTIILAGGLGSRISEETLYRPKPLIEVAGKPMIEHIMEIYSAQGFSDFVVATGYLGHLFEPWAQGLKHKYKIALVDTGLDSMTGGRLRKCIEIFDDKEFLATYGDGVGNIAISEGIDLHHANDALVTLTAVKPPVRFGALTLSGNKVQEFKEKDAEDENWINGGFFVLSREVTNWVSSETTVFESDVLPKIAGIGRVFAHLHRGFWHPMDTLKEKQSLDSLAKLTTPPWLLLDRNTD